MITAFAETGWDDFVYWQNHDPEMVDKIINLIRDIKRDSFRGIGKPEPLKGNLTGYWSRRITGEHRLVYRISGIKPDQRITIIQARFHYQ